MSEAIKNFIQLDKINKIVILGDMFELGTESIEEHKQIINLLLKEENIGCNFIGKHFYSNKIEKSNFHFYDNFDSFASNIKDLATHNSTILIKGSRGMALERTLEYI